MLPALCYCSVISSLMPLWWLEENRIRGDDSYKLKRGLNFLQFCIFSEPEMGKLPVQSRASSTSAFPHCHPNITPILGGARRFTVKKHLRRWVFCHSEAKESLWLGWVRGGKLNSLLLTASSLNLHCLLISCIPVEKSRLKTQVVKTPLVFSTNAGGSMAALSRSGVELAFRRSLFPI